MFWKKNEKIETLKELLGTRTGYLEAIKALELDSKEKEVFLLARQEVKKKNPNLDIIDKAYDILIAKSFDGTDETTNKQKSGTEEVYSDKKKEQKPARMKREPVSDKSCQECGAELRKDAKFCSKCGVQISQTNTIDNDVKSTLAPKPKKSIIGSKKYVILFVLVLLSIGILYRYIGASDSISEDSFTSSNTITKASNETSGNDVEEEQNDNKSYKIGNYTIESNYDDITVYIIERNRDEYYGNAVTTYDFEQECKYYEGPKDYKGRYNKVSTYNYPLASAELDFEYAKKYKKIKYRIRCTLGTKTNGVLKPYYGELLPERYSKDELQYAIERNCISLPRKICSPEPYNTNIDFSVNYHKFLQVMREHKQ